MQERPTGKQPESESPRSNRWACCLLLVVVVLNASVRWRLLDAPLERDEGGYAYVGQLMLRGVPPYVQAYGMRLPGTFAAYALMLATFGETHRGIHLGLLVINAATVMLVFLLARRLFDETAAVVAAASFAVLSISQGLQGVFANSEHLVILPAVGGMLLLLRAADGGGLWPIIGSGLLLGLSFLMKQHGIVFVAFGAIFLLIEMMHQRRFNSAHHVFRQLGRLTVFLFSAALPYLATCLLLWSTGAFKTFWFWTVRYSMTYVSKIPFADALENFQRSLSSTNDTLLLWLLAGFALTALVWDQTLRRRRPFLLLLSLCSFVAICPGLYFRPHYYQLTTPVVALLVGVAVHAATNVLSKSGRHSQARVAAIGLFVVCLAASIYQQRQYLFAMKPIEVTRTTFGRQEPFPEAMMIADYIERHSHQADRIVVIGSEPEIYFYAGRRAATAYIYMHELVQDHQFARKMQQELVADIQNSRPKFLVFVGVPTSWGRQPPPHLLRQLGEFTRRHYDLVGTVNVLADQLELHVPPRATWPPRYKSYLGLFERKD
jgi:4-amino-4-deoxy-L-arabinose transferase-like glycosyltransferase